MSIPEKIHQIWIPPNETRKKLPGDVQWNCNRWKTLNTKFEYKLWSLDDIYNLIEESEFPGFSSAQLRDAISVCRFPAMQADLGRLLILYKFGGFWVDLKLIPKEEFLEYLMDNNLVLVEHQPTKDFPEPDKYMFLNNCFFACGPESPFIKEVARKAFDNVCNRKQGNPWNLTGPGIFRETMKKKLGNLFEVKVQGVYLIRHDVFFGVLVGFGYGSYNGSNNSLHWSARMNDETVYLDRDY